MRRFAALAFVACALVAVGAADGVPYLHYPDSQFPAWLDNGTIRFQSNYDAYQTKVYGLVPHVMAADGSGARLATGAEAAQTPASPPLGESLEFEPSTQADVPLYFVDGQGHRRLIEAAAYRFAQAALSPDGRTAVFANWVGWYYSNGATLYAVPTDGSSEPRRLTPTPCTSSSGYGSPLGGSCLDGTDGPDTFVGTKYGDLVIAGSGDDTVRAGDGQNLIETQWGNDDIRSGSGVDYVWAGSGDDVMRTGGARDYVNPGPGRDRVFAGAGPDVIIANDGQRDVIDCGPGDDRARVDRVDLTRHCEHVKMAPPAPDAPPP